MARLLPAPQALNQSAIGKLWNIGAERPFSWASPLALRSGAAKLDRTQRLLVLPAGAAGRGTGRALLALEIAGGA